MTNEVEVPLIDLLRKAKLGFIANGKVEPVCHVTKDQAESIEKVLGYLPEHIKIIRGI